MGNLAAVCRPDHLTKTAGSFGLAHLGASVFQWTTPSGHRYRRDGQRRITMAPRRRTGPDDGDPPPF